MYMVTFWVTTKLQKVPATKRTQTAAGTSNATFHWTNKLLIGETSTHSYRLIVFVQLLFVLFLIYIPFLLVPRLSIPGFIC